MAIEPMTATMALASVKNAFSIANSLKEVIKTMGKVELLGQVVDLQQSLFDTQAKQLQLLEENHALRAEIKKIQDEADIRSKLVWTGSYYQISSLGVSDGIYCPNCWDDQRKLIRLQDAEEYWQCYACDRVFTKQ